MLYDPRTIAFLGEVFHPPMAHEATRVQAIHNELFGDSRAGYRNFNLVPGGVALSNPPGSPSSNSSTTILGDRIRVVEELTDATLDDYLHRLDSVLRLAAARLEIPLFTGCQISVRSLVNPRHFRDSREFLARGMFRLVQDDLAAFARPSQTIGLRMVFPQHGAESSLYALRIESYNADPRSLYLENVGTFPGLIPAAQSAAFADSVRATYGFLVDRALTFLGRFDVRTEP
ncbi:MAG TPA: hypothetical protein VKE69_14890 [Planctomycetota bacterium]|nr:hypothetical protein [Planctomycetota bacterium]